MARIVGAEGWPPRPVKALLGPLGISGSGMGAMSRALDIIAEYIANAETTRTPEDGPYMRKVVVDIATEPVDLMIARRVHETNATVFQAAKAMLRRAVDV